MEPKQGKADRRLTSFQVHLPVKSNKTIGNSRVPPNVVTIVIFVTICNSLSVFTYSTQIYTCIAYLLMFHLSSLVPFLCLF